VDPLELVRSRNRADIELPSGLGATIGLVRVRDAVTTGLIPLPVLREMDKLAAAAKSNGKVDKDEIEKAIDESDPSPEIMVAGVTLRREMVRRTLKRLAPSLAELNGPEIDMPAEVVEELSQEDFDVLSGYAMRDVPFPAASLST
jgi:hypothetical protein